MALTAPSFPFLFQFHNRREIQFVRCPVTVCQFQSVGLREFLNALTMMHDEVVCGVDGDHHDADTDTATWVE